MPDLARQLLVFLAGLVDTLTAWHLAGAWSIPIVAGAASWCMAQYDPLYQRGLTLRAESRSQHHEAR